MTLIIRIIWFTLTFALYVPIRNALEVGSVPGFIMLIFHFAYLLFIVIVPSNAFVSMWKKRTSNRIKVLVQYMWSLVDDYCRTTNSPQKLGFQICIMTAFYYSILDILQQSGLEIKLRSSLFAMTFKAFNIAPSDSNSQGGIIGVFNAMLQEYRNSKPDPQTPQGVNEILDTALIFAQPYDADLLDNETYFDIYTPSDNNTLSFQEKINSLRYNATNLLLLK